jgi:putative ABC transport system substrate-binding protein
VRRRRFVAWLGAAACTRANAQQSPTRPRIVVLHPASVEGSAVYKHLVPGLAKLGYVDGKTVTLDLRSGNGVASSLPKLVADAIASHPRLMIVVGPAAVREAAAATRSVPIVAIDLESDPVQAGWMQSMSRPGGNVTGLFLDVAGISVKRVQLLREAVPGVTHVAFVWDASTGQTQLAAASKATDQAGMRSRTIAIDDWTHFADAMMAALQSRPQALVILPSPVAFQYSAQLAQFTKSQRTPAISPFRPFPEAGGLMSYGPDLEAFFARAPEMVGRILRGANPAEIAVEQPVKYELVINGASARELNLKLPRELLVRADEVIR